MIFHPTESGKKKEEIILTKNMDKLYLDTNVILDYLQKRPNAEFVEQILLMAHNGKISLTTSVLNFATIFYIERRRGHTTREILKRFGLINKVISPADQSAQSYYSALKSKFSDFENALQHFAAIENGSSFLITGNKKDFKESALPVLTAKEYIANNH